MIHYYAELGLWIAAMFFAGCPLGALARRLWDRGGTPGGDAPGPPAGHRGHG